MYMCFHSRTTFSPLQTNGLLCGSREQLNQYNYTTAAAVDTALRFITIHTNPMERLQSR